MKNHFKYLSILPLVFLCACEKPEAPLASGTFETTETVSSSEVAGKLLYFDVEEGMELPENKEVAKIDFTQFQLQKKSLEAQIEALKNTSPEVVLQLSALEERLEKQYLERDRVKRLIEAKSANQKTLDDILSEIKYLEKSILAKKSTLDKTVLEIADKIKSINAQIEIVEDNIAKCNIKNPVKGTVLTKYAQPNEIVSFGKPLYKIGNLNEMRLRAYFSSADITKLKIGQKLIIEADFGENETRKYEGTLIWVSDKSEFTPKGIRTRSERSDLVFATKIAVKNDGFLKIGQYAEVVFSDAK